jgi:hypothetical protein
MCIAILNTANIIDQVTFFTCWENNPDGAGIAYVEKGTVKILKEMDCPDALYHNYLALRKHNQLPMILHFRIATSGDIDETNCHPFPVHPGVVMAHNGILENVNVQRGSKINDTRIFINDILKLLPVDFIVNIGIQRLISAFIGDSKLVFLDKNGHYDIINESLGHWDEAHENWFSNHSYVNVYQVYGPSYPCSPAGYAYYDNDWTLCEGCENWVETDDIVHDKYLGAIICSDCQQYYYQNLIREA